MFVVLFGLNSSPLVFSLNISLVYSLLFSGNHLCSRMLMIPISRANTQFYIYIISNFCVLAFIRQIFTLTSRSLSEKLMVYVGNLSNPIRLSQISPSVFLGCVHGVGNTPPFVKWGKNHRDKLIISPNSGFYFTLLYI